MKLITLQAQLQYNSRTTPYEGKGGGEIKIQTLNLKKMYRNYRKISRFKKQYLKMDFWVNNPKNKMHLAWKLVFTHLYMPDAIIYIHDISVILQKIGRKAWHKGHAISWQHEGKQKKKTTAVLLSSTLLRNFNSDLTETAMVSLHRQDLQDWTTKSNK